MAKISLLIQELDASPNSNSGLNILDLPLEEGRIEVGYADQTVRSDGRYKLRLRLPSEMAPNCADWRLWLNGKELDSVPHWNERIGMAEIPFEEKPFKDLLAFALFSLRLEPQNPDSEPLYAPPVKVDLGDETGDRQIQEIAEYVTEHAQGILVNRKTPRIIFTKVPSKTPPDFPEVISFLKNIVQTYQFDADYFRSNSRSRIKLEGRVDAIERLRYFTPETLRFISMHPEELIPASSSTGIRYGGLSFEPVRTWIQGDKVDRNVYENQIVLGFLQTVINHTESLINQTGVRNPIDEESSEANDTKDIAELIQKPGRKKLLEIGNTLLQLNNRLRRLYILYNEFMEAEPLKITRVPEPTPVFLSIPAYNRIYNLLHRWFGIREVTFEKNSFFMDAWRISHTYEYYCLVRLIEEIKAKGFSLDHQIEFPWKNARRGFQGHKINNIYYLKKGEERVTVYYEPVIGCYLQKESGLLLYKNSTGYLNEYSSGLHFDQGSPESRYTPDYVVKYETKATTKYLIGDAKFSKQTDVVALELITLLFKYRISISTVQKGDLISGLSIFCGKKSNFFAPLPLFNVQNPFTHNLLKSSLNISQIMPSSNETLLPEGFINAY